MKKKIVITIEGKPLAKSRPRIFTRGGRSFAYDKQSAQMNTIKDVIRSHLNSSHPFVLLPGPLSIQLTFYFQVPKSFPKKKFHAAIQKQLPHITKPDIDNLIKAYLDCCSSTVYVDDKQVVEIIASKWYSLTEYTVIEIFYDEEEKKK